MKFHFFTKPILLMLLVALTGCRQQKETADLLVYNARIYTVDSAFSTASALAVRHGRILAVGNNRSLLDTYQAGTLLDAEGRTIIPGLIDAHCHFYDLGLKLQQLDLRGTKSFDEVLQRVAQFRESRNPSFLFGKGWDQNDWEEKEFPDKSELDSLYPELPVVLERIDGHAYLVNQKVLDLAGIDANTLPSGGDILKTGGQPNGILIDGPMALVNAILPGPSRSEQVNALSGAEEICLGYGLTTVNDAGLSPSVIALIDSLQQAGQMKIRVYAMVSNSPEYLNHFLAKGPIKTERLNVRSFKVYADGALGSRGAVLKTPYSDRPGHFGAMVTPIGEIRQLAERLAASEFQMNTHAIGDSANAFVLRTYKEVLDGRPDRRWKVEHAQVVSPADLEFFGEGILPSVQPTHATSDMYWAETRLGPGRITHAYAWENLRKAAGMLALGTDFPVEEVNPYHTFYTAVARQDLEGYPEGGYYPEQGLSREDALRGMTIWAAYSNFEEAEKGSIEAGKWADFVILNKDLMEIPEEELPGIKPVAVYLAGEKAGQGK